MTNQDDPTIKTIKFGAGPAGLTCAILLSISNRPIYAAERSTMLSQDLHLRSPSLQPLRTLPLHLRG